MDIQWNPQDKDFNAPSYEPPVRSSKMVGWVVKLSGGTISESQANYVLIGLAGVFFILAIIMVINATGIGPKKTTYKEDIPPEIKAAMPPEVYNSLPSRGN